jgi:hypothetical protein
MLECSTNQIFVHGNSGYGPELVDVIRAMVPVVTGTSNLGAPLATDFSMADGLPSSHNENYVHSRLQDTVEAHQLLLDNIVCFAMSDTRRFPLDDHMCGTPLWVLAPHPPPKYLPTVPCYCR